MDHVFGWRPKEMTVCVESLIEYSTAEMLSLLWLSRSRESRVRISQLYTEEERTIFPLL